MIVNMGFVNVRTDDIGMIAFSFVIFVSTKKLVKRKEFEQFISEKLVI
jgi:hypothetical protein